MSRRYLEKICAAGSGFALAIATIGLIGGSELQGSARAATAAFPTASGSCHGDIGAGTSSDPTDLPAGNIDENLAFFGSIAPGPTGSKPINNLVVPFKNGGGNIGGVFVLTIDAACPSSGTVNGTTPPCVQSGSFTGSITKTGVATVVFTDLPGSDVGTEPLDGCQEQFHLIPYGGNKSGYLIGTSSLSQAPTPKGRPAPPTCNAVGTRFVIGCTLSTD